MYNRISLEKVSTLKCCKTLTLAQLVLNHVEYKPEISILMHFKAFLGTLFFVLHASVCKI